MNNRQGARWDIRGGAACLAILATEEDRRPPCATLPCLARRSNHVGPEALSCALMVLLTGAVLATMWMTAGTAWSLFFNPYIL